MALSRLLQTLYPKLILTHEQVQAAISNHILLEITDIDVDLDAYMCVRRDSEQRVRVIYINMQLVRHMVKVTDETEASALYTLFIGTKLAHECEHVLHYIFSGDLRASAKLLTPSLRYTPTSKMFTIDDIGDAIELELFGSLIRMIEGDGVVLNAPVRMKLKLLVGYPHLTAKAGLVILHNQLFLSDEAASSFQLQTGEVYERACQAVYHPKTHARKNASGSSAEIPASARKQPAGIVRY